MENDYHQESLDSKEESSIKLRDRWNGKNTTICNERLYITHYKQRVISVVIILIAQSLLYYGLTECFDIYQLVVLLACILSLMGTVLTDPGVIPKIYYKYEDDHEKLLIPQLTRKKEQAHALIIVQSHSIRFKYCPTCKVYRSARMSHCGFCNNCVLRFDHHCNWIGTCIGRRNLKQFYILLMLLNILLAYECGTISQIRPLDLIFLTVALLFLVIIFGLWVYHTYLIIHDITTAEHLKKTWLPDSGNPNDLQHYGRNCLKLLFQRQRQRMVWLDSLLYAQIKKNNNISTVELTVLD